MRRLIDAEPLEEMFRLRMAQCSNDYGSFAGAISGCLKLVQTQPTVDQPPNDPLTLKELRGMDGEPVWVEFPKCPEASRWMLVSADRNSVYDGLLGYCDFENSGTTWLAYRRKRSEGTP